MNHSNPLIKKYGDQKRWVNWTPIVRDGKTTKLPAGKSNDPETWSKLADLPNQKDIGLMFGLKKMLLGIDIDKCLNPLDGEINHPQKEAIEKLIESANTYTEVSPSGTGLHLFLDLTGSLTLKANRKGAFECYTSERYFTVTQIPFKEEKEVRSCTPEEAETLLTLVGYPWKEEKHVGASTEMIASEITFEDDVILKKMFASKNGDKLKLLYEGDTSQNGGDHSIADLNLCGQLAFWCQGNYGQIERLWMASPLGQREKTQTREDYRKRTIEEAIAGCKEFYKPTQNKAKLLTEKLDLDLLYTLVGKDKVKVYTLNTENICRILRKHPEFKDTIRLDDFRNMLEIKENGVWRDIKDSDGIQIQTKISILFDFFGKVGKQTVFDAIELIAKENRMDSAIDYVKSTKWDGVARLDSWLSMVYGVPNDEYHKKVGANWLKGLVHRIIEPGCKFDYVLVLEGEQGIKKSTSLNVLGNGWHVETTMSTESKDFFMQFQGKAIIEFSEGETLSRTEVKRMKAIITMQSDKYRPAYGRYSVDFPRRCVFAMTTNQTEYLKDETGNRRWLPVSCAKIADIDWLKENRDQLFAEAYHRLTTGKETTWEFPEEEMIAAQNARQITDPNTDIIEDWYWNKLDGQARLDGVTIDMVYRNVIHGAFSANKPMSKFEEMNISNVFKNVLKLQKKRVMVGGARATRWYQVGAPALIGETTYERELTLNDF